MQIACCQFDLAWEDKPANYRRVRSRVERAELEPGTLLLLPEMFATGYSMNAAAVAEPIDGPTAGFLAELAAEHQIFVLAGAAVVGPSGRPRNEALAFGPTGDLLARYAKVYPFTLAGEQAHYEPGGAPTTFHWNGCRVAPIVCYDLRFPELFRQAVRDGAELFAVIANWPSARAEHWTALLRARAIENLAYAAGCNCRGRDPSLEYPGRSQIIDPRGNVLEDAGDEDGIIRAEVDLPALREYRSAFPALQDIKPDVAE